ncbi:hypothetical protein SAMN05444745_103287 [Arthrobacter sp. OV608]|nr:hypothetical protein SAMN05444745_103287 [Arthrobacter sp. OV608]
MRLNACIFLTRTIALPIGCWLLSPITCHAGKEAYRNDEDLYTSLSLCGEMLLLLGVALIVTAVFRGLRKIDWLTGAGLHGAPQPDQFR